MVVIGLRQYVELNPRSGQYTLPYCKVLYPLEKYRENCTYFLTYTKDQNKYLKYHFILKQPDNVIFHFVWFAGEKLPTAPL